jgi:hypothetical protein
VCALHHKMDVETSFHADAVSRISDHQTLGLVNDPMGSGLVERVAG